jgi:YD repeat-containing protein
MQCLQRVRSASSLRALCYITKRLVGISSLLWMNALLAAPLPPPSYGYTNLTQLDFYVPYAGPYSDPLSAKLYIDSTYAAHRFIFAVDPQSATCSANVTPFYNYEFIESTPPTNFVGLSARPTPHTYPQCDVTRPDDGFCVHAACAPATAGAVGTYQMYAFCPSNSRFRSVPTPHCDCPPEQAWASATGSCVPYRDRYHDHPPTGMCLGADGVGNPIFPLTGAKTQEELLLPTWGRTPLRLAAIYSSRPYLPDSDPSAPPPTPASALGLWSTTLHKQMIFQTPLGGEPWGVQVERDFGYWSSFERDPAAPTYHADAGARDRLVRAGYTWYYYDLTDNSVESYAFQFSSSIGKVQSVMNTSGAAVYYTYSDPSTPLSVAPAPDLIIAVADAFGRSVQFNYEGIAGNARITRIIDPAGQPITAGYDALGRLATLTWPDGAVRHFLYELPDVLPWALTGVIDENLKRYSTYGYDFAGRALQTTLAGGVQNFGITQASAPYWNTVETYDPSVSLLWRDHYLQGPSGLLLSTPSGSTKSITAVATAGGPRIYAQSQPAGSGCAASTSAMSYDSNGNIASKDDFNGNRVCMGYDLTRNLETARVEGLASSTNCVSVVGAGGGLPAGSLKVSTMWHPTWRLETRRAEPLKLTTWVHNGQPDPFNGGAIAACAPASATLPDGSPIAVLCKQVEQVTTDVDGSQGFSATPGSGSPPRQQSWTYNQYGQVLTAKGPRTDVNDTTTYAYYTSTDSDHNAGDLQQIANPLGQVTRFTKYNRNGQLLQMVDANNVVTESVYDLRQRLMSSSVGGLATFYHYDSAGQLLQLTQADGATLGFAWDDAHRLAKVTDQAGNSVTYVLDAAGNRTVDQIKDASGTLVRTVSRTFDALNRVQQSTGAGP